jgi:hypothetical protein
VLTTSHRTACWFPSRQFIFALLLLCGGRCFDQVRNRHFESDNIMSSFDSIVFKKPGAAAIKSGPCESKQTNPGHKQVKKANFWPKRGAAPQEYIYKKKHNFTSPCKRSLPSQTVITRAAPLLYGSFPPFVALRTTRCKGRDFFSKNLL